MTIRREPAWFFAALLLTACGPKPPPAASADDEPAVVAIPSSQPSAEEQEDAPAPAPRPSPPPKVAGDPSFGRSKENAIEVCHPGGQRRYLSQLRCPDGQPPSFGRRGNVGSRNAVKAGVGDDVLMSQMDARRVLGPGETDYHIVDLYEVVWSDKDHEIYMDMYHCAAPPPKKAPSGFTIVDEE
jgi:hypothetical protein